MDLHLIENIVAIADEKSITKAAEKRFVTQSALNQQLQKLETELGTPLFRRARGNWQPTQAGEAYLQAARSMLLMKKDAYDRIAEAAAENRRRLSVGLIPERGVDMFTAVYPAFHRAFPEVRLEPVECPVRRMQKLISLGEIDLGLATLTEGQMDENIYHPMAREEILLAVTRENPLSEGGAVFWRDAPETDLLRFAAQPFIRIYQTSTMSELTDSLFAQASFSPKVLFSTSSNVSKYRIVEAGLGCALLPACYAGTGGKVVYFRLPQRPSWQITLCSRKDGFLGKTEKRYIELCKDYWRERLK